MDHSFFDADERARDLTGIESFATGSRVATGFGYLNADGTVDTDRPVELWITCRMTHVFSLAHLRGVAGAGELAAHGVACLSTFFHDHDHGGWFAAIGYDADHLTIVDDRKAAYAHAFVVLASSSATIAGIDGARELLDRALANQEERWWEADAQKVYESFDRTFTECEDYRGVNANMHTTECYLAAFDATDDRRWLDRAVGILRWVIDEHARGNNWRIPEHFDAHWREIPDYNIDRPKDPFRPFGYTPGHGLEWARLALHAGAQLARLGEEIPAWIVPAARALVERAVADGWHADGEDGFVYTVDATGAPVARERMHWVLCEAIGAASVLADAVTGGGGYAAEEDGEEVATRLREQCNEWWSYAQRFLIERPGEWLHELDEHNRPSTQTWPGKPDAYHVAQMLQLPSLPIAPTFARAIKER